LEADGHCTQDASKIAARSLEYLAGPHCEHTADPLPVCVCAYVKRPRARAREIEGGESEGGTKSQRQRKGERKKENRTLYVPSMHGLQMSPFGPVCP